MTIVILIFVLVIIRVANTLVARNSEYEDYSVANTSLYQEGSTSPNVLHTDTTISGTELTDDIALENQELIKNFIQACNAGDINTAYSYLSSSCKNKIFPSIEDFTNKYYNSIFDGKKEYNIENWISNEEAYTYRIYFVSNILSSRHFI